MVAALAAQASSARVSDVFAPAQCHRLIVKIGSALLVDRSGHIRRDWLETVVADVAQRRMAGQQIAIVSSGAIALGARVLGLPKGGRASLEDAQAAAATGQIGLSSAWAQLLHDRGLVAAQMLVTLDDLEDRRRYLNAAATLDRLLALSVVPVINENDSVATTEIRFGDNDRLAARVGQAAAAAGVILLSDIDGLYTANPGVDPSAAFVPEVRIVDARIRAMADGGSASGMGSGGMFSKLEAARIAQGSGAHLAIVSGKVDHPLSRFAETGRGTLFWGGEGKRGRKAWLAGRLTSRGRITVDAGAIDALRKGRSLLAAGATAVAGQFARGDVVEICDADGAILARGLAEYDATDAARIVGHRSDAHGELLGYAPRSAMIHRDHMVLV